jgi:hypothetical protein
MSESFGFCDYKMNETSFIILLEQFAVGVWYVGRYKYASV